MLAAVSQEERLLARPKYDGSIMLKWMLKERFVRREVS